MNCPDCGAPKTRVWSTRDLPGSVIRLRYCPDCGRSFHTAETRAEPKPRQKGRRLAPESRCG